MKVGLIVDGHAEFIGIPRFLDRVQTSAEVLRPIRADMQPFAPPGQIAHRAAKKAGILLSRGASKIIVLIDHETRPDCTPRFRRELEREMRKRMKTKGRPASVHVVVKETMFENWLVADPGACKAVIKTSRGIGALRRHVEPNKADNVDALALLKQHAARKQFDKRGDGAAICAKLDPNVAAQNSRSFRRFLRLLGNPDYAKQSKRPKRR